MGTTGVNFVSLGDWLRHFSILLASHLSIALRHLTASLLKRTIQADEKGHCSEEDAVASLELAIRRAQEGPSFRIHASNETMTHLFECLRFDRNQPIVFIGPSAWLKRHVTPFESSAHALACETIEDSNRKALSAWLVNEKRRAKLVWANLVASEALLDTINEAIVSAITQLMFPNNVPPSLCIVRRQICFNAHSQALFVSLLSRRDIIMRMQLQKSDKPARILVRHLGGQL